MVLSPYFCPVSRHHQGHQDHQVLLSPSPCASFISDWSFDPRSRAYSLAIASRTTSLFGHSLMRSPSACHWDCLKSHHIPSLSSTAYQWLLPASRMKPHSLATIQGSPNLAYLYFHLPHPCLHPNHIPPLPAESPLVTVNHCLPLPILRADWLLQPRPLHGHLSNRT